MGRAVNLSPLGLYNWDSTVFDLMQIPEELDRDTLIDNLLAETAELEVLYPNPVVFKNLVGVWSQKQLDIWQRLYATTQYEYNPIENYNRYDTSSDDGSGSTVHSGTDTTTDQTTHGGTDGRTEAITHGGRDTATETKAEGGTQTEEGTTHLENSGQDVVTGTDTKGHWIAGFNAQANGANDDGLVKQTRDQDDAETTTAYGKEEDGTSERTTTFGKTENNSETMAYGKTENVTEQRTYGQTENRQGSVVHGERIQTENEGTHEGHSHGNIGVTTTQKLIREQRSIELFNLYDVIIEDFKMRFCILIY